MQKNQIAIFLNSNAGKGRANVVAEKIKSRLQQDNILFEEYQDQWPETLEHTSEAWVIGGDGTLNFFVNKYPNLQIPIAIFKAGTGNDLANGLFGKISFDEEMEIALRQNIRAIDVLKCNETLYLNTAGIGFEGEVIRHLPKKFFITGLKYYLAIVQQIFLYKPGDVRIQMNDKIITGKKLLISINNGSINGGGFKISPLADFYDGKMDVLYSDNIPFLKKIFHLNKVQTGKHLKLPFMHYSQESGVYIETEKLTYGQLDGELISGNRFHFTVLPKYLFIKM